MNSPQRFFWANKLGSSILQKLASTVTDALRSAWSEGIAEQHPTAFRSWLEFPGSDIQIGWPLKWMAFVGHSHVVRVRSRIANRCDIRLPRARPELTAGFERHSVTMSFEQRQCRPSFSNVGIAVGIALSVSLSGAAAVALVPAQLTEVVELEKTSQTIRPASLSSSTAIQTIKPRQSLGIALSTFKENGGLPAATISSVPEPSISSLTGQDGSAVAKTRHKSLGERIAAKLREQGLPDELVVFLVSALPVVELRAGVPIGFVLGLHPLKVFVLSVVGNIAPIIPILLLLRVKAVQNISARLLERARRKAASIGTADSRARALAIFVGLPLPGTGAWTGSVVAFVLGMPVAQSIASLLAGVIMAACIMVVLCELGKVGALIAGAVLFGTGVSSMLRANSTPEEKPEDQGPFLAQEASDKS